jgi:hypothetical protein
MRITVESPGRSTMGGINMNSNYLFPEQALARVFQSKFMDYFEQTYKKKSLYFPVKPKN